MLWKSFGGGAALWLALSASAWAQDAPPVDAADNGEAGATAPAEEVATPNPAMGQFDADSDGQLIGDELRRARDFMQALRGAMGNRERQAGPPRDGDGRGPMRDRGGRGERGRRGGPPPAGEAPPFEIGDGQGPPRPEGPPEGGDDGGRPPRQRPDQSARLFREFDDNEDGQLNRDEFIALMGALRERRGPGYGAGPPEGGPDRPERRRGGEGGGPPRGRRGGDGFGPPRGEDEEGGRRPPRDGDVGQSGRPDALRENV